jgi:predicted metal-dependent phosphoesterase TrpH
MLRGALHIHSTYSDGEFSLVELREKLIASACAFACVTDHADAFDEARLAAYRHECERLSDARFQFVAGLEFTCIERMHILGYGVAAPVASSHPETVIQHIQAHGGLAVIAHPKDTAFAAIETFEPAPDGVEVWNSKYDGRYAPRAATFDLVRRLKARAPHVHAFYGIDLHWRRQYRGLLTDIDADNPDRRHVLAALAAGRFVGVKDRATFPSDGVLSDSERAQFARVHRRSQWLRIGTRSVKRNIERLGLIVPQPIKAELRRFF